MKKYEKADIKVSDIIEYENNARLHSDEQIDQIVNSIRTYGFVNPIIVDEHNNLIAGHGRLKSVKRINEQGGIDGELFETIPAIVVTGLSDSERRALIIADNKIASNSTWDYDLLTKELVALQEELDDMGVLGFSDNEMKDFFAEVEDSTTTIDVEAREIMFANLVYKRYKIPMSEEEADHLVYLLEAYKIKNKSLCGFVRDYLGDKDAVSI